jgi:hypothetical protein
MEVAADGMVAVAGTVEADGMVEELGTVEAGMVEDGMVVA